MYRVTIEDTDDGSVTIRQSNTLGRALGGAVHGSDIARKLAALALAIIWVEESDGTDGFMELQDAALLKAASELVEAWEHHDGEILERIRHHGNG